MHSDDIHESMNIVSITDKSKKVYSFPSASTKCFIMAMSIGMQIRLIIVIIPIFNRNSSIFRFLESSCYYYAMKTNNDVETPIRYTEMNGNIGTNSPDIVVSTIVKNLDQKEVTSVIKNPI